MVILSDENCDGYADKILRAFRRLGFDEILELEFINFGDTELERGTKDEDVWRFCQARGYILLTNNRTAKDKAESLEMVLRRFATDAIIPVLTIGDPERVLNDSIYCSDCAETIAEIVWEMQEHRHYYGTPRIFIPLPKTKQ